MTNGPLSSFCAAARRVTFVPDAAAQQGAAFFDSTFKQGFTLYEPMEEFCTELEACLRNDIRINTYFYMHQDVHSHKMACHRLTALIAYWHSDA